MQRTSIIGRLGGDPQLRYTPDGVAVTNFSVAVDETISKQSASGERSCPKGWKESHNGKNWVVTTWYRVTVWRKLAEICNQFLSKGRQVYVEGTMGGEAVDGTMNVSVYEANDGTHKASYELTARSVEFLGGASSGGNGGGDLPLDPPPEKADDWS